MLDDRKAAILTAVVEEYIETASPVGSGSVAKSAKLSVSSATVRNELAALESDGYLQQPHTSAGRIPTEKGYRYFVDALKASPPGDRLQLGTPQSRLVLDFFTEVRGELETMLQQTAGLLSNLTDQPAVVIDHSVEAAEVRSVQLVPLADRVVLAVVVFANGAVEKHTMTLAGDVAVETIERVTASVRAALEGRPLAAAAPARPTGDPDVDGLVGVVIDLLGASTGEADRVYVDGTSRVASGFEAIDSVKRVLTILEQQLVVVNVITDVLDRGLSVAIGTETGEDRLGECSVVVSPYEIDGERAGSIAVLGPTRMNYPQAMATVAVVSRQLGRRLSEG